MKFTFDVGYAIKGRRPGKKQNWQFRFAETVSVDIREIDEVEAQIAVEWLVPTDRNRFERHFDQPLASGDVDGRQFTRWFEGRHWLRLVERHVDTGVAPPIGPTAELTITAAMAAMKKNGGYEELGLHHFKPSSGGRNAAYVQTDPTDSFEETVVNEREVALAAARDIVSDVILVNGVVHVACAQPGLRLTQRLTDDRAFRPIALLVDTRREMLDGWTGFTRSHFSYALDEWDEVVEKVDYDNDLTRYRATQAMRPVVHIPESIDPDIDARRAADRRLKQAVKPWPALDAMTRDLREFFEDNSGQRSWRIEKMLRDHGKLWDCPLREQTDMRLDIQGIEDGMDVDIGHAVGQPSRPGP